MSRWGRRARNRIASTVSATRTAHEPAIVHHGSGSPRRRVKAAQVDRRQRLAHVGQARGGKVGDAREQGRLAGRNHGTPGVLGDQGDDAGDHGQNQERQLFHTRRCEVPVRARAVEAAERPVVQEQQRRRQGHQHRLRQQSRGVAQNHQDPGRPAAPTDVDRVHSKRQQAEKHAEGVLALRNPDHGLHAQGVDRKERRGKQAGQQGAGQPAQDEKEQRGGTGMQQDAGQVVAGGVEPEQGDIGQVRDPRQGVPVGGVAGCKSPADVRRGQSPGKMGVGADVERVVKRDEIEAGGRREQREGADRQEQAE